MSTHEREAFERTIVEYLDGALDAHAAEALLEEVNASPERRAVFEQLEMLWQALRGLAQAEGNALPAVDVKDAVLTAIAVESALEDQPDLEAPTREAIAAAARELIIDPEDDASRSAADDLRARSLAHRDEVDAYAAMAIELEAIAQELAPSLPSIDIRDAVLATIAGDVPETEHRTPSRGVVSFQRGRRHRAQSVQWPLVAAAAVLLTLLGSWSLLMPRGVESPIEPMATPVEPAPVAVEPPVVIAEPAEPLEISPSPLESAFSRMAEAMPERTAPPATVDSINLAAISSSDVWTAQQAAIRDADGRASIRALASLPAERARALAETPNQRPEVVVGAAASLPPIEAQRALLALREDGHQSPSLVFAEAEAARAVAKAEVEGDEDIDIGISAIDGPSLEDIIAELRAIDPDNALSYYWEAINLLQQGDLEGALTMLEAAEQLESAHAYSLEGARATQAALEAAGMSPDAAMAAAALSAGMSQYDFLTTLGQDLLDEAFRYEAMGFTEAAEQILSSAQRFGAQIEAGSPMSWEQLAGLDLQRAAIEALESFFISTDDLVTLTNDALGLVANMDSMASFFDAFNSLFLTAFDADFFNELSQAILGQGDIDFFAAYAPAGQPATNAH